MHKYATNRWIKAHPNNVATHGSTEPIMSVLDVRGFEIRDLFVMGLNDACGTLVVPTKDRAVQAQAALEPAYKATVRPFLDDDWSVEYTRRHLDGSESTGLFTDVVLADGTVVIREGRWVC